jgi:hypothetical protein
MKINASLRLNGNFNDQGLSPMLIQAPSNMLLVGFFSQAQHQE